MSRVSPPDAVPLAGRVAVVTGASRGIGRAVAIALAREGMKVLATARDAKALDGLAAEAAAAARDIVAHPADCTREDEVAAMFGRLGALWGPPHLLVNAAGAFLVRPAADTTFEEWRHLIDTNLTATFLTSREAARVMQPGAAMIQFSSVGGRIGLAGKAAYCASKFGVVGLSRALARELEPRRIRVVVLYPYTVDSAGQADWAREPDRVNILAVEDVARTVVFLAGLPERVVIPDVELNPLFRT